MARVFIAVGSNIGPCTNIPKALRLLKETVKLEAVSNFYETMPIGSIKQPAFVNGVVLVTAHHSPRELKFDVVRCIEQCLGRIRTNDRWAPRTIDLDVILYDDLIMNEPDIVIPDPDICKRVFIAIPLCELDPHLVIPGASVVISEIADSMNDVSMVRLNDLTKLLRSEINSEPGKS